MRGILWAVPLESIELKRRYPIIPHAHITLAYDVDSRDFKESIGVFFSAPAITHCWNAKAECFRFVLQAGIPFTLKNPHLTLSYSEGSAPIESKLMLESGEFEQVGLDGKLINFRIEFFEFPPT